MEENFDTKFEVQESPDSKKYNHLEKGVSPINIILCHDSYKDRLVLLSGFWENPLNILNLDFEEDTTEDLDKKSVLHSGFKTYTLSPLDKTDKVSEGFYNCVGFAIIGTDENGEEVSASNHIKTLSFLSNEQKQKFISDLKNRLIEVNKKCRPGTKDAIIFGGNYSDKLNSNRISFKEDYLHTIHFLKEELKKGLGFEARIPNGPSSTNAGPDNVYIKTKNREIILIRGHINQGIGEFLPSDIVK